MDLNGLVPDQERRMGYWVDLDNISLADSDDGATSWVHAMSVGEYKHPLYGKIQFTTERISRFAQNVVNRVRGIDIAIDFSHNNQDAAAGWVTTAEARNDGLWLLINWTKEAAEAIREKKFRYFSPEFVDEYQDAKSGTKFKDVLLGGGLTNRPFLKDLLPVNLSEVFGEEKENDGGENVTLDEFMNKLRKELGLGDDADEDAVMAAVQSAKEVEETPKPEGLSESELGKLMSENPQVKALVDRVAELETTQRFTEVNYKLKEWVSGNGKRAIPAALQEDIRGLLTAAPPKLAERFEAVIGKLLDEGLVDMTETPKPGGPRTSRTEESASEKFHKKMSEIMEANADMDEADAYAEASRDEDLFTAYREEQLEMAEEDS